MATLETSPEANCDRPTGPQADRMTKPLIGARATALPKNQGVPLPACPALPPETSSGTWQSWCTQAASRPAGRWQTGTKIRSWFFFSDIPPTMFPIPLYSSSSDSVLSIALLSPCVVDWVDKLLGTSVRQTRDELSSKVEMVMLAVSVVNSFMICWSK